jgi:multisubunit Na+/H+ antiporter MnhB subunit
MWNITDRSDRPSAALRRRIAPAAYLLGGGSSRAPSIHPVRPTGTVTVLTLMAVTSLAVIGHFRTASGEESPWTAYVAPALGFAGLVTAIYLSLHNFDTLAGVTAGPVTYLPWLIPIAREGVPGTATTAL